MAIWHKPVIPSQAFIRRHSFIWVAPEKFQYIQQYFIANPIPKWDTWTQDFIENPVIYLKTRLMISPRSPASAGGLAFTCVTCSQILQHTSKVSNSPTKNPKKRGDGIDQGSFGTFPKIHPFLWCKGRASWSNYCQRHNGPRVLRTSITWVISAKK